MSKGRSQKYNDTRNVLIQRIRSAYFAPGAKFMSNRAVCQEFDLSYPTVQTLMRDLAENGYVERRRSGTFIPGVRLHYRRACLIFHPHSRIAGTFGAAMLEPLKRRLSEESIPWTATWSDKRKSMSPEDYIVLWERGGNRLAREFVVTRRRGLLLNTAPNPGKAMELFDSILIDYFAAGEVAGRVMGHHLSSASQVTIVANPPGLMGWVEQSVLGFRIHWPRARVMHQASTLDPSNRQRFFKRLYSLHHDGVIFFTMSTATQALEHWTQDRQPPPFIIVIDKPPRPSDYPIVYVGVSLEEFIEAAVRIIRNRLHGDPSTTSHITIAPGLYLPSGK